MESGLESGSRDSVAPGPRDSAAPCPCDSAAPCARDSVAPGPRDSAGGSTRHLVLVGSRRYRLSGGPAMFMPGKVFGVVKGGFLGVIVIVDGGVVEVGIFGDCDTGAGAVDADDVGTVDDDAVDIDITLISR